MGAPLPLLFLLVVQRDKIGGNLFDDDYQNIGNVDCVIGVDTYTLVSRVIYIYVYIIYNI